MQTATGRLKLPGEKKSHRALSKKQCQRPGQPRGRPGVLHSFAETRVFAGPGARLGLRSSPSVSAQPSASPGVLASPNPPCSFASAALRPDGLRNPWARPLLQPSFCAPFFVNFFCFVDALHSPEEKCSLFRYLGVFRQFIWCDRGR